MSVLECIFYNCITFSLYSININSVIFFFIRRAIYQNTSIINASMDIITASLAVSSVNFSASLQGSKRWPSGAGKVEHL